MMFPTINRAQPAGPLAAYETYQVAAPLSTHYRPATCQEVDCGHYRDGWRTVVDERTDLGARQAAYVRAACRPVDVALAAHLGHGGVRRYVETSEDGRTVFTFPPGQPCFTEHRVSLERPQLYVVRDGDWRGNPTGRVRRHTRPEHWVEDCAEAVDRIHTARQRG
jgi:hypothetical protein